MQDHTEADDNAYLAKQRATYPEIGMQHVLCVCTVYMCVRMYQIKVCTVCISVYVIARHVQYTDKLLPKEERYSTRSTTAAITLEQTAFYRLLNMEPKRMAWRGEEWSRAYFKRVQVQNNNNKN